MSAVTLQFDPAVDARWIGVKFHYRRLTLLLDIRRDFLLFLVFAFCLCVDLCLAFEVLRCITAKLHRTNVFLDV